MDKPGSPDGPNDFEDLLNQKLKKVTKDTRISPEKQGDQFHSPAGDGVLGERYMRYWMLSKVYRPLWMLCDTNYEIGRGADIYARNAARETLDMWRIHDATLGAVYSKMLDLTRSMLFNMSSIGF